MNPASQLTILVKPDISGEAHVEVLPEGSEADLQLKQKRKFHSLAADTLRKIYNMPSLTPQLRKQHAVKINTQLRAIEYELGLAQLQSWPQTVELPVAGNCNLRCEMCSLAHGAPTYAFWTLQDVARFKELFKFATSVNPTGVGEPLMARDFFPILEYFKSFGLGVGFYTNATLMDEKKSEKLIVIGADTVSVSLDGATKETFERIRVHAKWEPVIRNIRRLVAMRDAAKKSVPRVQIAMVLMKDNIHEFPAMVRLTKELGADRLYAMYMSKAAAVLEPRMPQNDPRRTNEFLVEGQRLAKELDLALWIPALLPEPKEEGLPKETEEKTIAETPQDNPSQMLGKRRLYCSYPWMQYLVHNDGGVAPCCQIRDHVDGKPLGNINNTPPEQLWNSEGMVYLRQRLLADDPPGICRNCKLRTSCLS